MKYPNIVYKCPGDHQCLGGTFSYLAVKNDDELEKAIDGGWYETLPGACGDEPVEVVHADPPKTDNKPPTRKEILKKCDELEIPYTKKMASKSLLALIDKAI